MPESEVHSPGNNGEKEAFMAVEIVVPELSESVIEATVSDWLKNEGDSVEAGETVVVLETDKVSVEVTAGASGVLASIKAQEGDDVQPGDVLGTIDGANGASAPEMPETEAQAQTTPTAEAETRRTEPPEPEAKPQAQTQEQQTPASTGVSATPVAQRMATEHGVDIAKVQAAGDRVTKEDVQKYLDSQKQAPQQQPTAPSRSAPQQPVTQPQGIVTFTDNRGEERQRMSRRRRTIATRLVEAQQTAAMLTTFNEVDMSAVMELRSRRKEDFKERHGVSLGLSSFFVKASIGALKAFPRLNAEIQDNEIVLKKYYDIGIAIGAEEGLIVPVLRNADSMTFAEIERQIREYAAQAQDGTISIESLMGGTFTITNGGVFGSMLSTPILNPPQVGILGLHGIKDRAVVIDGKIVIRPMMYLALTYDHRIVDGREAVQFLVKVKDLIEDPESLLIEA
jgi:2-oxoglutarate dehydrogenase E2 component (dihydrolipoamide succinyltransferase)